ncbi:MAG TPA: hypothetical protein PKY59_12010 [Pyrinomonadaceae bacterium]|nr:hypothetical protein [Pyrinomonadaceae bacterium]
MSKRSRNIFYLTAFFTLILQTFYNLSAQTFESSIKLESLQSDVFKIKGKFLPNESLKKTKNLSFLLAYASFENLGARVSNVNLYDEKGEKIAFKKLIDGEYLAEKEFSAWEYEIKISPLKNPSAMAHLSWFSDERGILMFDDLFPQFEKKENEKISAKVSFDLPKGLKISSIEKRLDENTFFVENVEKSLVYIAKDQREQTINIDKLKLNLMISGDWLFTDSEAAEMLKEIVTDYKNLFGAISNEKAQIFLVKFPKETEIGRWEAETRGANVTILSADMPFKKQSLQRLHEQLRHEIFHLWIPNGLNLSGNYDWFYEGFALYQSLRTGVGVNKLSFENFLDTLSRAHSIDSLQTQKNSLIESSKNRWNGANTQVYARGMLVAFLCDLAILQKSKGKKSLTEVFRQIFAAHGLPNARQEGNMAILNILQNYPELRSIIEKYIKGSEQIAWQTELDAFGIESKEENFMTKLAVKAKLGGRQKDLLDKLGYNNWRKLSESSK